MLSWLAKKVVGSKNEREIRRLQPMIQAINDRESALQKLSDTELQRQSQEHMERAAKNEPLDSLLPDAFATVREASRRVLGMRHFDVQLLGGIVLHEGKIAEMKTGEGKTLVATLPVYLNAITKQGVHVVTVNDYLARRDAEWMGRLYSFLSLQTGVVVHGLPNEERQAAYSADITYGQNNEFGFDYLRDNMVFDTAAKVQRGHSFAIVDEVDSILVDEARTPLIISGRGYKPAETYQIADQVVRRLQEEEHYTVELKSKQISLTDEGVNEIERILSIENLYDPRNIELVHRITQALKAHAAMKRDVEYVVRNNQVIIVDEFTGRMMPGRRWSDGLHQAVEAKEGVPIAEESITLATITFQNYFRMYKKLAGMTGTADTESVEFKKIYKLDVIVAPPNRKLVRIDHPDVVYRSEKAKFQTVCDEIEECYSRGQPVLVGTASIAKSEVLSELLSQRDVPHHVLNAKQHEREAEIVAQAGRLHAVTISTNMAGRGTDILLGGNPEFLAAAEAGTKDSSDAVYQEQLAHFRELCAKEHEAVITAGGLHILGTERHESRRIDNQLRGRAGRQGDPGSSRFHIALDDDLMKRFGGERMQSMMTNLGMSDDDVFEHRWFAQSIETAQKRVESYNFDVRKHLLEYDDVLNKQREVVYTQRDKILGVVGIEDQILEMIPDTLEDIILSRASEKDPVSAWDIKGIVSEVNRIFDLQIEESEYLSLQQEGDERLAQIMFDQLSKRAIERYQARRDRFGSEQMAKLGRIILLQTIDTFWIQHLTGMDHLRDAVSLRGYGQQNPLQEYQREAFTLFSVMWINVRFTVLNNIFTGEIPSEKAIQELEEQEREREKQQEAAQAIHQDFSAGGSNDNQPDESANAMNREQRRRAAMQAKHTPKLSHDDYAPSKVSASSHERDRKEAARKKAKEARKARKKAR